jgi:predicted N-acetyltransferase YhbS
MNNKIIIRHIEIDDYPDVSRLVCASFKWGAEQEPYSNEQIEGYFRERGSVEAISEQFKAYQTFVACIDSQIRGMVSIEDNEIAKLYVDPEAFRLGIGRRLIETAEEFIHKAGYSEFFLGTIFSTNHTFYEAMGMRRTSEKNISKGPFKGSKSVIFTKK